MRAQKHDFFNPYSVEKSSKRLPSLLIVNVQN